MNLDATLFTSESVTEGHPDKMADQISDAILDAIMTNDPENGRVACETFLTTGLVVVGGEITTETYVDIPSLVRETIREIGYTSADFGFDFATCGIMVTIDKQSPDIAMGVDPGGAGDQGMMFGYATNETEEYMPFPIMMAHKLAYRLSSVRKDGTLDYLRPDGKSQVSVRYENAKPVSIENIVISSQHSPDVDMQDLKNDIIEKVIKPIVQSKYLNEHTVYHINPTGRFVVGGPQGDSGLTGRKIIVDTYGGMARHGGGAFSGKDTTKVDRSAAYMARYIAKNIVAAGLADRCEVQLAYAIGVPDPVSILVDSFGTSKIPESKLISIVRDNFELTPKGIIKSLDLRQPIFKKTAAYGHFGRTEPGFTWEQLDKVDTLKSAANL